MWLSERRRDAGDHCFVGELYQNRSVDAAIQYIGGIGAIEHDIRRIDEADRRQRLVQGVIHLVGVAITVRLAEAGEGRGGVVRSRKAIQID
jgi:hypothetical protein